MTGLRHQSDSAPRPLPRSSSAHPAPPPSVNVGATGSILSLVDLERCSLSADATSSFPDQQDWVRSGRSKSTSRLPSHARQGDAVHCRLETVAEVKIKLPKWKQFLNMFRKGSNKVEKPKVLKLTTAATGMERKQESGGESVRKNKKKFAAPRGRQLSMVSASPYPLPQPKEKPSSLLWERRNVAQLTPLDLTRPRSNVPAKAR